MKLTILTTVMLLSTATYAFAGGGAPVPEGAMKDDPSGRPGKILSEAECTKAWEMAGPDGPLAAYGLVSDPELAKTQEMVKARTPMGPLN